jgi:hypothetical protein
MAPNVLIVIGLNGNDSDSNGLSVSGSLPNTISACMQPPKEASSLYVLHLYWRCLTSGNTDNFPVIFDPLIDHSSNAALISEEYVSKLGLCCKRLPELYLAELAMEKNGQKVAIEFSQYVKLQLHDPSSYWSSKSVCAIIAPGLCTPMILGLPFLVHNDIVVDAAARTVIDKKCGFDLLHPVPPPLPPPPKQKLKDFFKELQQDHKLMVVELKLVCHDRCCHMEYKFEEVKLFDIVAVVRQCVKVLTAQKELQ